MPWWHKRQTLSLDHLPIVPTGQLLPVGGDIIGPLGLCLHLEQNVLTQMLAHQPCQALFVLLQGRSAAPQLGDPEPPDPDKNPHLSMRQCLKFEKSRPTRSFLSRTTGTVQMDSNYPLVRMTNTSSGNVSSTSPDFS